MWFELRAIVYFLYIFAAHILKGLWTELTEDKSVFVEYHFKRAELDGFKLAVTVEVAVVCSKEFADNFNQDRQTILDYLSAYFWDMSIRFRTLHQNKISFSVTSLTIIKSKEEQPFIENARHPVFGNASVDAILPLFQKWISSKFSELAGFDVAMLLIQPLKLDGGRLADRGGVAEFKGGCHFGTNHDDYDKPQDSTLFKSAVVLRGGMMTPAMYEMAVLLGATREQKLICDHHQLGHAWKPKVRALKKDLLELFSLCTDVQIKDFIKSPQSSCLQSAQGEPIIDPDFDSVLPPSIKEQCRLLTGSRNATAVTTVTGNECALTKCQFSGAGSTDTDAVLISPLANSRCGGGAGEGGGRCFHGRCIPPGFLLFNMATGKCLLRHQNTLTYSIQQSFELDHCPRSLTAPSERFHVAPVKNGRGNLLKIPCQALYVTDDYDTSKGSTEEYLFGTKTEFRCMDMCLKMGVGSYPDLEKCDETRPYQRWEFRNTTLKNGEFLLYNEGRQKCVVSRERIYENQTLLYLDATEECDKGHGQGQPDRLWKFIPVLPEKTLIHTASPTRVQARLRSQSQLSLQKLNSTNLLLNVSLTNPDGGGDVAVVPGVIVSWRRESNSTLMEMPGNCFPFPTDVVNSVKCKLGRMLQKNETTLVATLNFNATTVSADEDRVTLKGFCATPTMATRFKSGKDHQSQTCL